MWYDLENKELVYNNEFSSHRPSGSHTDKDGSQWNLSDVSITWVIQTPNNSALCSLPAFNTTKLDHHELDNSNYLPQGCRECIRKKVNI